MKTETPRDGGGEKLCAWCGGPIRQSGVGRSRDYCSRTHREYAYRARREAELRLAAYARGRADERGVSSTDARQPVSVPSVDETGQIPAPPPNEDFLLAPPAPPTPPPAEETPAVPAPAKRRRRESQPELPIGLWGRF